MHVSALLAAATTVCLALKYLSDSTDVWTVPLWWAAGPWWGNYIFTMEPPSGVAFTDILPSLVSSE